MGQFRNTDTWTKEQKAARVEAMLSSPARIIYDWERAALNELALSQSIRWLLEWGYSTPKILESLVGRSARFTRQLLKQKIVATTPRVVHSRDKSQAQIGMYVKAIRITQLMPSARAAFLDRQKAAVIDIDLEELACNQPPEWEAMMELQRQEHEREDKEEERLRKLERKAAIKRGEEVEEEEEECDGYPRSNEIDHPKILRHNLLVQRVSARIVKQLREDSLEVACYSPRTLGYHGYLKHRESNLELKKFQPDSVLYLDIRPEDRSPEVMAKRPWLDGKLGYCVEVERSKKTDAEIKRFADKIVHLNDYFSVVLVTDGRKAMDIMLNRLYKFVHPDTNEPISRLVRTMVIEEKFDEKDPF